MSSHIYKRLGLYTFWMFTLQNSIVAFSGLFIFILLLVIKASGVIGQMPASEGAPNLHEAFNTLINLGILGSFALLIVGILLAGLLATIQYWSYRYYMGDNEFHVKKGILNTEELSIPYRHIIDIGIERPLIYQLLGASILTIYSRTETNSGDHPLDQSEGRLPAIKKRFAEDLRAELLSKAKSQDIGQD